MWNVLRLPLPSIVSGLAGLSLIAVMCAASIGHAEGLGGPEAAGERVQIAQAAAPKPDDTFDSVPLDKTDMVLGNADAPVTIVEYASLTCPHCAQFHGEVLPKIKRAYIDTGKAKLVYRDFPLDRLALSGSMLARCARPQRYFGFIDLLFKDQMRWSRARNPMQALGRLARLGGMSQAKFDACLKDEAVQRIVLEQRLAGGRRYKINSTPTLIVNGRKYSGGLTFDQIRAVLEPMLSTN